QAVFPDTSLAALTGVRHYFHPPALSKCFPRQPRLEYISGAVAWRVDDYALLANTRVVVGERDDTGYPFQLAQVTDQSGRDVVQLVDAYPGFLVDARKIELATPKRCTPYGVSRGCRFDNVGRYRRTPPWLDEGDAVALTCRVRARGADCRAEPHLESVRVGGSCDIEMQPVAGVR
ncbi:MAG TPA: hypothetical protein VGC36_17310, partial [Rhizomicrobium sp.]